MTTPQKGRHGGHREGAGRPPDPATYSTTSPADAPSEMDADARAKEAAQMLHAIMLDPEVDVKHRVAAAKALMAKGKATPTTKREEVAQAAQDAASGRFGLRKVK